MGRIPGKVWFTSFEMGNQFAEKKGLLAARPIRFHKVGLVVSSDVLSPIKL